MPPNFKNFKKKEDQQQPQATNSTANQQQVQQNQPKVDNKSYGGLNQILMQLKVWEDEDDSAKQVQTTQQTSTKGKPNFLKKEQPAPPPPQVQQSFQVNTNTQQAKDESPQIEQKVSQPQKQTVKEEIKINKQQETKISNIPLSQQFKTQNEFELLQPDQLENPQIKYEGKFVEDVIAPGGVRLKQNQNILDEFCSSAQNVDTPIIGSLLISKLYSNLPLQQKARTVYAIQELIRKQEKYKNYFKHHLVVIQSASAPQNDPQGIYPQEIKLIATLVDNQSASNEASDIKFEFKSNLLSTVQQNKAPPNQNKLSPRSDTNNTSQASSNTINLIDDLDPPENDQKKKGFDFIKKNQKGNNNVHSEQNIESQTSKQPEQVQPNKKGFSFLKKKTETHSVSLLDSPQTQPQPSNDNQIQNNQQPQQHQINEQITNVANKLDNFSLNGQNQQNPSSQNNAQSPQYSQQQTNANNQQQQQQISGQQQPNAGQYPQQSNPNGGYSPYGQYPPHGFYPPHPQYPYGMYPPAGYPYPPHQYQYPQQQGVPPTNSTNQGQPSANYAQPPAHYGQPPANYGQPPANYGQPPANYGQPPQGYMHPQHYGYPPYYGQMQGFNQGQQPQQEQQKAKQQQDEAKKGDGKEDAFNFIKI